MRNYQRMCFPEDEIMTAICDAENIAMAWEKVYQRRGRAGSDGITVQQFAANAQGNLMCLQEELITGAYQPAPLLRFYMDKGNGEQRALNIPTVYDRIAQQAVSAVITPLLDATFEPCSYGYRKGKGRRQAIEAIVHLRDAGHRQVLNADIEEYFDSVQHPLLIQRFADLIPEESVVRLIANWLQAEILDGNNLIKLSQGLPQGDALSPLLSNLYLDLFDKVMMERGYSLIRYVDDFVILERQSAVAQQALQIVHHLLGQLGLNLKPEKTEIVTFKQGFQYLGVLFVGQDVLTKETDNLRLAFGSQRQMNGDYEYRHSINHLRMEPDQPAETFINPLKDRFSMSGSAPTQYMTEEIPDVESPVMTATAVLEDAPFAADECAKEAEPLQESWIIQQLRTMQDAIQQLRTEAEPQEKQASADPIDRESQNQTLSTSRLLSTLYIQEQGSALSHSQKRFLVTKGDDTLLEVPAIKIGQIMIFGQCNVTTPAIRFCLKAGIPICFISSRGSYYGRLTPPTARQVTLQQKQFLRSANQDFALRVAKGFVSGKIHNQRVLLQRRKRKLKTPELAAAVQFLAEMLQKAEGATSLDELRGYEGTSSARYFGVFGSLLDSGFSFSRRMKFPPPDPVNAMLSFGYTLLFQNIYSLVEAHNLHPYCGHLHALRDGHPALVSDLVEEFRAPVVDSLVIYLVNSHIIKPSDFELQEDSKRPCLLNSEARKAYVQHFESKMQKAITHPHTGYTVDYRRCLDLQITELAQCVRGERETYRPMKVRS